MDAESILTTFTEAIRYILDETGFRNVTLRSPAGASAPPDLVVATGITGILKGILMVKFCMPDAVKTASTMLEHVGQTSSGDTLDESHKASLSEIANLFSARFVNLLSAKDIDCNLTPPSIITGSGIGVSIRNLEHTFDLEAVGNSWRFHISFYVTDTSKR